MPEQQNPVSRRIEYLFAATAALYKETKNAEWETASGPDRMHFVSEIEKELAEPGSTGWPQCAAAAKALSDTLFAEGLIDKKFEVPSQPRSVLDGLNLPEDTDGPVPGEEVVPEPEPLVETYAYIDAAACGDGYGLSKFANKVNDAGIGWRHMHHTWSRETYGKSLVELTIPAGLDVPADIRSQFLAGIDASKEPGLSSPMAEQKTAAQYNREADEDRKRVQDLAAKNKARY